MRPHQLPNYTSDISEYLEDVDAAIQVLKAEEGVDWLLVNGHSTGGLVAALHAHRGHQRTEVNAVFLNSPFLDMNIAPWQEWSLEPWIAATGAMLPHIKLPGLPGIYGQSLHADHQGTWRYNIQWKPIEGFPIYAGWFRAIHHAHAEIAVGLSIECPVLVMHSKCSAWLKHWSQEAMITDIVLDVADMVRLAPRLGSQVEVRAIKDGIHDLVLSTQIPRKQVFKELEDWLNRIGRAQ
jgi:alpha-beta hydrolase superfamily lysophospholipase